MMMAHAQKTRIDNGGAQCRGHAYDNGQEVPNNCSINMMYSLHASFDGSQSVVHTQHHRSTLSLIALAIADLASPVFVTGCTIRTRPSAVINVHIEIFVLGVL